MRVPLPTYRTFENTTTMEVEADSESSTNVKDIVSSDDGDSTSSSNVGSRPGRKDEDDKERSTKRRRVTTPPAGVPARTPPAPAAPTAARTVRQIIVDDLRSDDETTLVKALKDLWSVHLSFKRDDFQEVQDEFIKYGGHLAVSWIMEKHPNYKEIQRHGICVVVRASYWNIKNIRKLLGETRCIRAICSAMRRFHQDKIILRNGFGVLSNLTYHCESNCKILVEELDALPFLVEGIESLPNDVYATKYFCGTFLNISILPQLRRRAVNAKALSGLAHAMENHGEHDTIPNLAKQAFKLLLES
jgi:hypothetical protein